MKEDKYRRSGGHKKVYGIGQELGQYSVKTKLMSKKERLRDRNSEIAKKVVNRLLKNINKNTNGLVLNTFTATPFLAGIGLQFCRALFELKHEIGSFFVMLVICGLGFLNAVLTVSAINYFLLSSYVGFAFLVGYAVEYIDKSYPVILKRVAEAYKPQFKTTERFRDVLTNGITDEWTRHYK